MSIPWFLKPPPTPAEQRATIRTGVKRLALTSALVAPAAALAALGTGMPPFRTAAAFVTAPFLYVAGLWLIARPFPVKARTTRPALLALSAVAGVAPGLAVSALVTGAVTTWSGVLGALSGWTFMAWLIWDAYILPTDAA